MKKFMTAVSIALLVTSCASTEKNEKNPFDALTLKETLKEGKTSQTEVVQTFGAPDITTEDTTKNDVWIYSKHKNESSSNGISAGALAFLPGMLSLVGGAVDADKSESSSKTVTLTLLFDKNKKLKSYQLTKIRI